MLLTVHLLMISVKRKCNQCIGYDKYTDIFDKEKSKVVQYDLSVVSSVLRFLRTAIDLHHHIFLSLRLSTKTLRLLNILNTFHNTNQYCDNTSIFSR